MTAYMIKGNDSHPVQAVRMLFSQLLEKGVDYVFLPGRSPYSKLPMPMLISDVQKIEDSEPLVPAMPFNSAKQASSVLKTDAGKKIALLLKPCEKRALIELEKLCQCSLDNALIITADCPGRVENSTYLDLIEGNPDLTESDMTESLLSGAAASDQTSPSCRVCTQFTDEGSDIHINLMGCGGNAFFVPQTEKGSKAMDGLGCDSGSVPDARTGEVDRIREEKAGNFEALTEEVLAKTKDITAFQEVISNCLNCYNCRTACPVCYCKECVFLTDVFSHMPETLLNRADKKGIIKLPTDTTMFHMTRLAHMSHACVGCGQCSSVCPSDIPVADIFKVVSKSTQEFFDYIPGTDAAQMIPYVNYKKNE